MTNLHETDRLVELLPCPFCGGEARIIRESDEIAVWCIGECRVCGGYRIDHPNAVAEITRAWNRRALTAMGGKAEPVVVKPPVWSEVWVGSNEDIPAWRAQGTLGWNRLIDFAHDHAIKTHADAPADRLAEKKRAVQAAYENAIRSTLFASPVQARTGEVTEEMVEAAEAAVYPRHERGFLSKPLIDPIDMRKALEAALSVKP